MRTSQMGLACEDLLEKLFPVRSILARICPRGRRYLYHPKPTPRRSCTCSPKASTIARDLGFDMPSFLSKGSEILPPDSPGSPSFSPAFRSYQAGGQTRCLPFTCMSHMQRGLVIRNTGNVAAGPLVTRGLGLVLPGAPCIHPLCMTTLKAEGSGSLILIDLMFAKLLQDRLEETAFPAQESLTVVGRFQHVVYCRGRDRRSISSTAEVQELGELDA